MTARGRGFTLIELLVVIAIIIIILLWLLGAPFGTLVFRVLFGWVWFVRRVVSQMQVSPGMALTAGGCLAGVILGTHWMARWLVGAVSSTSRWSFGSTLALVGVLFLMFTAGIGAIGVTHQTSWLVKSPEPMFGGWTQRVRSFNNLKQLGLAVHNHNDHKKAPVPAVTFDASGRALHGWPTHLLPYLEQDELYKRITLARPWNGAANLPLFRSTISVYIHPAAPGSDSEPFPVIHYALNARLVNGGQGMSLQQITDDRGLANTILLGEAAGNWKPWGSPIHWRDPVAGLNRSRDGFGSPVGGSQPVNLVMADGSVRSFRADTDPAFLELLATPTR